MLVITVRRQNSGVVSLPVHALSLPFKSRVNITAAGPVRCFAFLNTSLITMGLTIWNTLRYKSARTQFSLPKIFHIVVSGAYISFSQWSCSKLRSSPSLTCAFANGFFISRTQQTTGRIGFQAPWNRQDLVRGPLGTAVSCLKHIILKLVLVSLEPLF